MSNGGLTTGGRCSGLRDGPGPLSGAEPGLVGTKDVPVAPPEVAEPGVPARSSFEIACTLDRLDALPSSFSSSAGASEGAPSGLWKLSTDVKVAFRFTSGRGTLEDGFRSPS